MKGLLCIVLLAAACGGSSSSAVVRAHVTGTVDGQPFAAHDSAALVVKRTGTNPTVALLVSNLSDSCAGNDGNRANKQVLSIGITAFTGGLDAGSFPVYNSASGDAPSGTEAIVEYHSSNDTCQGTTPPNTLGSQGRVTLDSMSLDADGGLKGSFDVILQNGDRLKGTFDAPICPDKSDAGVTADAGCR